MTSRRTIVKSLAAFPTAMALQQAGWSATPDPSRQALVIGNSSYANAPLQNPANDAKAVGALFTQAGFTVNEMLEFAGVLRDVDPGSIRTYQIEARGMMVSGASVLEPRINGDNMKAILAIFQGQAPLAGAPEQAFETTTTTAQTSTTAGSGSTVAGEATTSTVAATTTSAVEPEENVKGDILPDPNLTC